MISAVLVNLNEGEKLRRSIESVVGFADEIIVVDLGSSDQSKAICQKFNTKFFVHKYVSFVEKVRNFAVSKASGNWILVLDPDEVIPPKLKNRLTGVSEADEFIAVNISRKNIFFGKWIAHTNWWPDKQIRFFKKGKVVWSDEIHKYPEVSGKVLDLESREDLAIIHYGYSSVTQFLERQNRYSTVEAEDLFKKGIKFSLLNCFWKLVREFLVRFIRHAGFLDGFYGFSLTILMMIYRLQVMIKVWELEKRK